MEALYDLIEAVAPSDAPVVIEGEPGTGKELVAQLIHARSRRAERPLVVVDCAALAPAMLELELFGQARTTAHGTGAVIGRIELAHTGSLLLDRVSDMPATAQARLLRLLETGTIERAGDPTPAAPGRPPHRGFEPSARAGGEGGAPARRAGPPAAGHSNRDSAAPPAAGRHPSPRRALPGPPRPVGPPTLRRGARRCFRPASGPATSASSRTRFDTHWPCARPSRTSRSARAPAGRAAERRLRPAAPGPRCRTRGPPGAAPPRTFVSRGQSYRGGASPRHRARDLLSLVEGIGAGRGVERQARPRKSGAPGPIGPQMSHSCPSKDARVLGGGKELRGANIHPCRERQVAVARMFAR